MLGSIIGLLLAIYLLLWIPPVQQKIKSVALNIVMEKTKSQISVGKFYLRPFSKVKLTDVYASDLKGDTLVYAEHLSADFSLLALLRSKLLITSVELENFDARVSKDSVNGDFNFQFFIDAFASPDKDTTSSSFVIEIDKIVLKDGRLSYDIWSEPLAKDTLGIPIIDYNHLHVSELNSEISLKSIDLEKLNVAIKSFSLTERSGLRVEDLTVKLTSDKKKIQLKELQLKLPKSKLVIENSSLDYSGMELKDMMTGAAYDLNVEIPYLSPVDIAPFYPSLQRLTDTLTLKAAFAGTLPSIEANEFNANYADHLVLNMTAQMGDYSQWDTTPYQINITKSFITAAGVADLNKFLSDQKETVTVKPGDIHFSTTIKGSLPDFTINFTALNRGGTANLNGSGGYLLKESRAHADIDLKVRDFDIQPLLPTMQVGIADVDLSAKGTLNGSAIDGTAECTVNRFDFNGYSYNQIQADVAYHNDSVQLALHSDDPNAMLKLTGGANLAKNNNSAVVDASIKNVDLVKLNFLKKYEQARISSVIHANVNSFDLERMTAELQLDSLVFATEQGVFMQDQFDLIYKASDSVRKEIHVNSEILKLDATATARVDQIPQTFYNTLSAYFPRIFTDRKKESNPPVLLTISINVGETKDLIKTLDLPFTMSDKSVIKIDYNEAHSYAMMNVDVPEMSFSNNVFQRTNLNLSTDTLQHLIQLKLGTRYLQSGLDSILLSLDATAGQGKIDWKLHFDSDNPTLALDGDLAASVRFEKGTNPNIPNIFMSILATTINVNDLNFNIEPAELSMQDGKYIIEHFKISHSETEYLKVDGTVSDSKQDTLKLDVAQFKLETIMNVLRNDIGLKGEANGEITVVNTLSSPFILTRGFTVEDIAIKDKSIGTLSFSSGWSNEYRGLVLRGTLKQSNNVESTFRGFALPDRDSLSVQADLKEIELDWIEPFVKDFLYGLDGTVGATVRANGKISKPTLSGVIKLHDAKIGVNMTQTKYTISDSINITSDNIAIKNFRIVDENGKAATIDGNIKYQNFSSYQPDLIVRLNDFMVLNNPHQTDSLFYGHLRLNGGFGISGNEKDIQVKAQLNNGKKSKVTVVLPSGTVSQAQQYDLVTYITPGDTLRKDMKDALKKPSSGFPLNLQLTFLADEELTLGIVTNTNTRDGGFINGSGNIDFSYNLATQLMTLFGDYTVKSGQYTLSVQNITKRTFTVQEGGTVIFKGDPLATAFDVTAVYTVRADLATLDPSFSSNTYLSSTRVPVNCLINVSGDINKMNITYDIKLPTVSEEIQRQVDGLLYSDDIKIKEIAYLLAVGAFWPPQSDGSGGSPITLMSLASSPISSLLNSMLSGVLNENWTVSTDFHATDNNLADLDVDLTVSRSLFKDRVTINTTVGYRNDANSTSSSSDNNSNFTGDFDVQIKINESGSLVLKIYTVTNDQFYAQAPTTQGVGILYQRSAKTFKQLFKRIKPKKNDVPPPTSIDED